VDTAVVWGPLAGYFAKEYPQKLTLTPVKPEVDPPGLPFTYTISMGVKRENISLRNELQQFLDRKRTEIHRVLIGYGVPLVDDEASAARGN